MSTNYTENFNLCQWEPTDAVIRTDFNADNEKIDAALGNLSVIADGVKNLAHLVYDLTIKDYTNTSYHGFRRGLLMENFTSQSSIQSLTGGVAVQNGALVLSGVGKTGTMTSYNMSTSCSSWKRVIAWVRYELGGIYSMAVNGVPLTLTDTCSTRTSDGINCREMQLEGEVSGTSSAVITLTLNTGTSASAKVYEYGVMFF